MHHMEAGRTRPAAAVRVGMHAAWMVCGLFGVLAAGPAASQSYRFDTVAGGFTGDGHAATDAGLMTPIGVAFDSVGNLYIAELMTNRIRKVDTSGVITTIAGGGYGFSGDGGAATAARFKNPRGLAFDAAGYLYVSDSLNHRVRKIAPSGVITTVAGNGIAQSTGDGGPAQNAGLRRPDGLAFDAAGNLYIAESLGHKVRKVTPAGVISTVAGSGSIGFYGDGGPATLAALYEPTAVTLDAGGNLYIADSKNSRVRRVTPGGTIDTVAGNISLPYGIATGPDDGIYVSDADCHIRKLDGSGGSVIVVGRGYDPDTGLCGSSGDGGPALLADIDLPEGIAFDGAGAMYFGDSTSFRVRKVSGGIISTAAGRGNFVGDGGPAILSTFSTAQGLTVGPDGSLFIADSYSNGRVRKVDPAGIVRTYAGNGQFASNGDGGQATDAALFYPRGVMLDPAGNLYITERIGNSIRKVGVNGIISTIASYLSRPNRTAMDAAGNIYIADTSRQVVRKLTPAGTMTVLAGQEVPYIYKPEYGDGGSATEALLADPTAVAVDAAGNVYIADSGHARVRKVNAVGIISTAAGTNAPGTTLNSGDGGLAINAGLNALNGLAFDLFGNLYIASTVLRKVTPDGMITTVKGMDQYAYDVATDHAGAPYVATMAGTVIKGVRGPVVASDFNGDGFSDMFWRHNSNGANAIWPTANLTLGKTLTAVTDQNWKVVGSDDFDGDGRVDILWRRSSGETAIWPSANYAAGYQTTHITGLTWQIVGTGDFDGNGKGDLLWRNAQSGANAIWRGANSADQPSVTGITDLDWKVVGTGDFDGDGKSDILWRNSRTGGNTIWPSGSYALRRDIAAVPDQGWKVAGIGDFDGDAKADILWRHVYGNSAVWKSADYTLAVNLLTVDLQWRIQAVGDYDGDGRSDILWRRSDNGRSTIWKSGDSTSLQSVVGVTDMHWAIVD